MCDLGSLVLWELGKKQTYIFNSNKLKDAIGASLIIKDFSEDYFSDLLDKKNFITKGGGKILYFFEDKEKARSFIKEISFDILKNYPGLELLITSIDMDFKNDDLKAKISEIYQKLDKKKNSRKNSLYQIAFGIERKCNETGLISSVKEHKEGTFISNEINIKRNYCEKKQKDNFQDLIPEGYKLEVSLDDLVKDGGKQYTGVIHIDGNGMGKKIKILQDSITKKENESQEAFNHKYKEALCKFSEEINKKYKEAFSKMCEIVTKEKDKISKETKINESFVDNKTKKEYRGIFPIRPIILAGDDITYVCNSSIAIESARIMLEILEREFLTIDGVEFGNLSACAGITIAKKGYSFKRAYELAEELCSSSKKFLLENGYEDRSAIDFQFLQGNYRNGLDNIREQYLSKNNEKLTMKPFLIGIEENFKTYKSFIKSLNWLNKAIEEEKIGRSKIKLMRNVFFEGKDATERFFKFYKIPEYVGALNNSEDNFGFSKDGTCLFLDGIEVMDFFIQLEHREEA